MSDELRDIFAEWRAISEAEGGGKYAFSYAAILLQVLSDPSHPRRDDAQLHKDALELARWMDELLGAWEDGQIRHIDEGLDLQRPPRWNQAASQRRASYRVRAAHLVRQALRNGSKTPNVFREVYESGQLPENVSASQIEKWYYECKKELPEQYG